MNIHIEGIPCKLLVTSFTRWVPATWTREAEGEIIWEVQDLDGSPAPELEARLSPAERASLERALIAQCTSRNEEIF